MKHKHGAVKTQNRHLAKTMLDAQFNSFLFHFFESWISPSSVNACSDVGLVNVVTMRLVAILPARWVLRNWISCLSGH
jgi:hypothetical protein